MENEWEPSSLPSQNSEKAASPCRMIRKESGPEPHARQTDDPGLARSTSPPTPATTVRASPPPPSRSTTSISTSPDTPQPNASGHFTCAYPSCSSLTFTRPCEWKKHTQRHTRPFHCQHPSCNTTSSTTRGFTYFGGLTRHEREVHGQHGGPGGIWYCPVEFCKRHKGEGFKRRDNMREHMRRTHGGMLDEVDGENDSVREDTYDLDEGRVLKHEQDVEAAKVQSTSSTLPTAEPPLDRQLAVKRKAYEAPQAERMLVPQHLAHTSAASPTTHATEDLSKQNDRHDVKRLRLMNDEKDGEIARLREKVARLEGAIHALTAPVRRD